MEPIEAFNLTALDGTNFSLEDIGITYPVRDTVTYFRPTRKKSGLLYGALALQTILTITALLLTTMFHSMPLDKGFGLISILSSSLNYLELISLDSTLILSCTRSIPIKKLYTFA